MHRLSSDPQEAIICPALHQISICLSNLSTTRTVACVGRRFARKPLAVQAECRLKVWRSSARKRKKLNGFPTLWFACTARVHYGLHVAFCERTWDRLRRSVSGGRYAVDVLRRNPCRQSESSRVLYYSINPVSISSHEAAFASCRSRLSVQTMEEK